MTSLDAADEIDYRPALRERTPLEALPARRRRAESAPAVSRESAPAPVSKNTDLSENAARVFMQIEETQRIRDKAIADLAVAQARIEQFINSDKELRDRYEKNEQELRDRYTHEVSDLRSQNETLRIRLEAEQAERIRLAVVIENTANSLWDSMPQRVAEAREDR